MPALPFTVDEVHVLHGNETLHPLLREIVSHLLLAQAKQLYAIPGSGVLIVQRALIIYRLLIHHLLPLASCFLLLAS